MSARHRPMDPLRLPRKGSALRVYYDDLLTGERHKGQPPWVNGQLRDFYNCQLQTDQHGTRLMGRWPGSTFVRLERLNLLDE